MSFSLCFDSLNHNSGRSISPAVPAPPNCHIRPNRPGFLLKGWNIITIPLFACCKHPFPTHSLPSSSFPVFHYQPAWPTSQSLFVGTRRPVFRNETSEFAINCEGMQSFSICAQISHCSEEGGSPTRYIFGRIERYLRNYVKIVFHIFRQIERRGPECTATIVLR